MSDTPAPKKPARLVHQKLFRLEEESSTWLPSRLLTGVWLGSGLPRVKGRSYHSSLSITLHLHRYSSNHRLSRVLLLIKHGKTPFFGGSSTDSEGMRKRLAPLAMTFLETMSWIFLTSIFSKRFWWFTTYQLTFLLSHNSSNLLVLLLTCPNRPVASLPDHLWCTGGLRRGQLAQ